MSIAQILWKSWAEFFFIVLLLIGFFVALFIQNAWLNYAVIFCAGLMAGRVLFIKTGRQPVFPFFLIIVGFLFGYMLGSFVFDRRIIAILFALGAVLSYYLHKKEYINF